MLGQVMAGEIKRQRRARDWTQNQLAERLDELNAHIDRVTLTRIEQGGTRAENLRVWELLAIAAALGTSPVALVFPVGRKDLDEIEVIPGLKIYSGHASKWFCAENSLTDERARRIDYAEWFRATVGTRLFRESGIATDNFDSATQALKGAEYVAAAYRDSGQESPAVLTEEIARARAALVEALEALADIFRELDQNDIAPPGVPSRFIEAWAQIGIEAPKHWHWEAPEEWHEEEER